jgi:hypothetical protein
MAQPDTYTPATAFAAFNPSAYVNHGTLTDAELAEIASIFAQYKTNIALLQRDDGALKNGIVTQESLSEDIYAGLNTPSVWAVTTAYVLRDSVVYNGVFYKCIVAHTSTSSFATDLAGGKWSALIDFSLYAGPQLGDVMPKRSRPAGSTSDGTALTASRSDHAHPALSVAMQFARA